MAVICISGCANNTASWMTDSGSSIDNKRITQITLPGAIQANAYDVDTDNDKCIGELLPQSYSSNAQVEQQLDNESAADQLTLFGAALNTQDSDIGTQLKRGTRYFDIQVCKQNGEIYTSNVYLTDKFSLISEQITKFLEAHPEEIIILDFDGNLRNEHGYMTGPDIREFHNVLTQAFGSAIVPKNKMFYTIGKLKNEHYQIIILSSNPELANYPDIWNKDQIVVDTDPQSATIKKLNILETILGSNAVVDTNKLNIIPVYSDIEADSLTKNTDDDDEAAQSIIINYLQQNIGNHPGVIVSDKTYNSIIRDLIIRHDINNSMQITVESQPLPESYTKSSMSLNNPAENTFLFKIESLVIMPFLRPAPAPTESALLLK